MTVKEAYRRVEVMKKFIGLLWIGDHKNLKKAYADLDAAELEYQELAFNGK